MTTPDDTVRVSRKDLRTYLDEASTCTDGSWLEARNRLRTTLSTPPASPDSGRVEEWRCFHCDEVFTDRTRAVEHFGGSEYDEAACKLNAAEGGVVALLRKAEHELSRYRQEDTALIREVYALGAKHASGMRREEEEGYARGLRDARLHPETLDAATPSAPEDGANELVAKIEAEHGDIWIGRAGEYWRVVTSAHLVIGEGRDLLSALRAAASNTERK